ncbi:hypothetical protein ACH47Z_09245 [Streptomyces sp. NPDC020192]|uniref:hypothetical protein n=1 Tax=Streptomyces sp. NPDC020192 TaxID=3365066 RepID=UPI0037B72200
MTAGHESIPDDDGMDALMAAITGEPVPEEARRDPAFRAEHRAAEADVAVLREQLALLAEVLTGEAASEAQEEGSAHTARPLRPGRPSRRRRALRIALGSLAGAAAFALVVGFGWMVTHTTGSEDNSATAASAGKAAGRAPAKVSGDSGRPDGPALTLACSRLVVEGTVAGVQPQKPSHWSRITLTVIRSYKPAHGPAEVSFLLDGGAKPAPRTGQHVLVTVGLEQRNARLWAVGDTRVAVNRAWITEALPASGHLTCDAR